MVQNQLIPQLILVIILAYQLITCTASESSSLGQAINKRSQCGGTITADSNSLAFPGPGESLLPGEACVWTIHLETSRDFRFNFSQFNVTSENGCRDAGIRLYALSNLVPPDRIESYTFCSESPAPDSFFLSGTVVAITIYVSESNTNPGSGITLNWAGGSFDPLRTKHFSSYSSATSGAIRYPIVGEYEPSLAATWTIDAAAISNLDFHLESLGLSSCANPDPCTCDALLLYQISSGLLTEIKRFCRDETNTFVYSMDSSFILAFFTDLQSDSASLGFQSVYYPSAVTSPSTQTTTVSTTIAPTTTTEVPTTSSTTQPPTTTEEYQTTKCGTVLNRPNGYVLYKEGFTFDPNERCVWIIRVPGATEYQFSLDNVGWSEQYDGLAISTVSKSSYPTVETTNIRSPGVHRVTGEVAIVTFYSDFSVQGQGFSMTYEANASNGTNVSRDVILSDAPNASLVHPESGYYNNFELSTFVYSPRFYFDNSTLIVANYYLNGLESGCECCDSVAEYRFISDEAGNRWVLHDTLCSSDSTATFDNRDMFLFIFSSDNSVAGRGFQVDFAEVK